VTQTPQPPAKPGRFNQLVAPQLALELDLALRVDAMKVEDGLGGVDANHANAHRGRLP
jgi:hypothetical protein